MTTAKKTVAKKKVTTTKPVKKYKKMYLYFNVNGEYGPDAYISYYDDGDDYRYMIEVEVPEDMTDSAKKIGTVRID